MILLSAPRNSLHFVNCLPHNTSVILCILWLVTAHLFQNMTYTLITRTDVNNLRLYKAKVYRWYKVVRVPNIA